VIWAEPHLRVVRAAVADSEEVGDLRWCQFVDAVHLMGAENEVEELPHLRLVAAEPPRSRDLGTVGAGERREGEADVGEHVEDVAVRRVDQAAHVLEAVGTVADLGEALDKSSAASGVAPDRPQPVLGRHERPQISEHLVHELLGGDRPPVVGPVVVEAM
jgi:hypothetical protein